MKCKSNKHRLCGRQVRSSRSSNQMGRGAGSAAVIASNRWVRWEPGKHPSRRFSMGQWPHRSLNGMSMEKHSAVDDVSPFTLRGSHFPPVRALLYRSATCARPRQGSTYPLSCWRRSSSPTYQAADGQAMNEWRPSSDPSVSIRRGAHRCEFNIHDGCTSGSHSGSGAVTAVSTAAGCAPRVRAKAPRLTGCGLRSALRASRRSCRGTIAKSL